MKTCPHCFSEIDERASVCPVCRRDVKKKRRPFGWCAILSALILLLLLLGGCAAVIVAVLAIPTGAAVNTPTPEAGCESVEGGKVCIGDVSMDDETVSLVVQIENQSGRNLLISREQIALQTTSGRTIAHDQELSLESWGEYGALDLAPNASGSIGVVFALSVGETAGAVVYRGLGEDVTIRLP